MIIGINGYIGSGKDTVGQIIQYLTDWKCLGFPSDKHAVTWLKYEHKGYGSPTWEIKKFAGKLKQVASLLTNIPIEKFEDQEFKTSLLGKEWWTKDWNQNVDLLADGSKVQKDVPMTVRTFLQKLGTEAMRDGLHKNVWVNALMSDYVPSYKSTKNLDILRFGDKFRNKITGDLYDGTEEDFYDVYPDWIITDVRFPNEAEAIIERGGKLIRVVRKMPEVSYTPQSLHPSETSLDNWEFDHIIYNDGTLEDLVEKVKAII